MCVTYVVCDVWCVVGKAQMKYKKLMQVETNSDLMTN